MAQRALNSAPLLKVSPPCSSSLFVELIATMKGWISTAQPPIVNRRPLLKSLDQLSSANAQRRLGLSTDSRIDFLL